MAKKIFEKIRKLWEKIKFERKMRELDNFWYNVCQFSLFPPSFYYRHSEEEIKQIKDSLITELYAKLAEFEERNGLNQTVDTSHDSTV